MFYGKIVENLFLRKDKISIGINGLRSDLLVIDSIGADIDWLR